MTFERVLTSSAVLDFACRWTRGSMSAHHCVRFGTFEFDHGSGELRRNGRRVPLQPQPAQVLARLVSQPGEVVSRDDLRQILWPDDTFVEVDTALNVAINKIRRALQDSATTPRFVETLPGRGYRFLADVHPVEPGGTAPATPAAAAPPTSPPLPPALVGTAEQAPRDPVGARGRGERRRGGRGERRRGGRWRTLAWSAAAAGVAVVTVLAWQLVRAERPRPSQQGRFELQLPPGVTLTTGGEAMLAISPDGRSVAFVGARADSGSRIYVRAVEGLGARAIPGTEGATDPTFSPDGRWLAFHSRGALRKVAIAGGEPQVLCEVPHLRGASWGEDGAIVFSGGAGLQRVAAAGGSPQAFTRRHEPEQQERWPRHLPGGRAVVFIRYGGLGEANHEIVVHSLATGEDRVVARGGTYPRYAAGQLVFSRQGTLYAAPFDAERLDLAGQPRPVLDDVSAHPNGGAAFDLSPAGSLVFSPGWPRLFEAELVRLDRQGNVSLVAERRAAFDELLLPSPDGRMLAVFIRSSGEEADLWTYELAAGRWTRLTADGKALAVGAWSHDGRWIFFSRIVEGAPTIVRIAVDGGSPLEPLTTGRGWDYPGAVTPDGRLLLFTRIAKPGDADLLTLDLGDRAQRPFVATAKFESDGHLSPDGRWAAYAADAEGSSEIYVRPYPGPGIPLRVSTSGGTQPRWGARGDEILFRCPQPEDGTDSVCAATVQAGERLTVASPQALFGLDIRLPGPFTVSPDGASLYMVRYPAELSAARRMVYAPSWIDELATTPP